MIMEDNRDKIFTLVNPYIMAGIDMIGLGASHTPIVRDGPRIGRNDPCPCGSGMKYKKCCQK